MEKTLADEQASKQTSEPASKLWQDTAVVVALVAEFVAGSGGGGVAVDVLRWDTTKDAGHGWPQEVTRQWLNNKEQKKQRRAKRETKEDAVVAAAAAAAVDDHDHDDDDDDRRTEVHVVDNR